MTDLVENPIDWFSCIAAHIGLVMVLVVNHLGPVGKN